MLLYRHKLTCGGNAGRQDLAAPPHQGSQEPGPRARLDAPLPAFGVALGFEMRHYREVRGPHQAPWPPGSCH